MQRLFSDLRARLLLLVLLAILPALGLLLFLGLAQRRQAQEQVKVEALQLARLAAADHERTIDVARALLATLAELRSVRTRDAAWCAASFAGVLKGFPLFNNLAAMDPTGDVFCSGLPLHQPLNFADDPDFRRAVESRAFTVSQFLIGRVTDRPVLHLYYPSVDEAGRIHTVLFVGLELGRLNEIAGKAKLPRDSMFLMLDRTGRILARVPDPDGWIGKFVPDASPIKAMLARQGEGTTAGPDLDGVPRLFAFIPVWGTPGPGEAYVMVGIPQTVAYAKVDKTLRYSLGGMGLVGLLALGAAWIAGDQLIVRRAKALLTATRRLAAGDLTARTGLPRGRGELDELAAAFDEMAGSLQGLTRQNRLILESAGEGIYGLDAQGKMIFLNPAASKMLGWASEELRGQPMHSRVHHTKVDGTPYPVEECPIYAAFMDGGVHRVEGEVFWRKDGTSFPVEYTSTPIREADALVGAVVVFRDITERRKAEETIRRSDERFRLIARATNDAVWDWDLPTNGVWWNEGVSALFGYAPEAVRPDAAWWIEHIHPEDRERVVTGIYAVIEGGQTSWSDEYRYQRADNTHAYVLDRGYVIHDEKGRAVRMVGAMIDVSERRRAEEALQRQREALVQSERLAALGRLAAGVAHELRNPLSNISMRLELMQMQMAQASPPAPDVLPRHLAALAESSHQMKRIMEGLSLYSKPSKPEPTLLNLRELLAAAQELVAFQARKGRVAIAVEAPNSLPPVRGDRSRLMQVLVNLATNAIEAMAGTGGRLTLKASGEQSEAGPVVRVEVADTGPGMPPEVLARIWEAFYTTKPEGTGLGLSIVRGIVADHAGATLHVDSRVGEGTTFVLTFPVAGDAAPDAG